MEPFHTAILLGADADAPADELAEPLRLDGPRPPFAPSEGGSATESPGASSLGGRVGPPSALPIATALDPAVSRSNPPAVRAVQLHTMWAYGYAATFKLRDIAGCFPVAASMKVTKSQLVVTYSEGSYAIAYDFGALVLFNVPEAERVRATAAVMKCLPPEPHGPLMEDFVLELDPGGTNQVTFDRVIVTELTFPVIDLMALLLAQSVAIDYYEEDLVELVARLDQYSSRLAETGRYPGRIRDLVKFIGSCAATKSQIIVAMGLIDKPPQTWEIELADRFYRGLRASLEIDERFRALEYKLRTVQETLELLVDLSQSRRLYLLEVTIVLLIAFEVMMGIYRMVAAR